MATEPRASRSRVALALVLVAAGLALPTAATAATVPLAQYGGPGGGAGEFAGVWGVAVDRQGRFYAVENYNERLSAFSSTGSFLHASGFDVIPGGGTGFEICTAATTCKAGFSSGGAGQLHSALGAAVDDAGNVYVGDSLSARISVFSPSGAFLRAFGNDVRPGSPNGVPETCTNATGCQTGLLGTNAGMLDYPAGVAIDGSGNVYTAESNNNRISVFGPTGAFLRAFGYDVDPSNVGTGFEVCTIATGCQAGASGGAAGQIASPRGVALDSSGRLYVAESSNQRISVFSPAPAFVSAFGYDVDPGGGAGFETCTTGTGCKAGVAGGGAGQLKSPEGVAVDGAGDVYVSDDSNQRISVFGPAPSFVRAFGHDVIPGGGVGFETCTTATTCKAGVSGGGAGQFSIPGGLAIDCRGALLVGDTGNSRVQRLGEPGTPPPPCGKCSGQAATYVGTPKRDVINGTVGRDVIVALDGNDVVRGLKGGDLICGGRGRDRLLGGPGRDRLLGQAGRDILRGGPGRDQLRGGPGRDRQIQ